MGNRRLLTRNYSERETSRASRRGNTNTGSSKFATRVELTGGRAEASSMNADFDLVAGNSNIFEQN